ncbi:MAG: circadian clock protein KaiC [Acidobacteria bacterium]|nr:MAG: circadian clock protein KaiC [Acidobacteriota bacterium]
MPTKSTNNHKLPKCQTGIRGLDEITAGGLPRGRPTLVCGGPGCGKTLMAMEFLVRGYRDFGEPGAFMAFEEREEELIQNSASLGFDLPRLIREKKLAIDHVHIERSEIEETGEYDLDALFVRLESIIDQVGAKRVALDTVEALFAGLANEAIVRAELRRLFRWLKAKDVTTVITAEQGKGTLTRHGLEEYVSDCVILLDHRVTNQIATRRLRVVKYRGSTHGANEYPTMIDEDGLSVLPISSLNLKYPVSRDFISTGVDRLDTMLNGKGYYKGSSILVSGTAGTGKTSLAAAFVDRACRDGRKSLYYSFEESPEQVIRNMGSIAFDLGQWVRSGLLRFEAARPTLHGLENHLVNLHKLAEQFKPEAIVIDPVTNLTAVGDFREIRAMLTRLIDFLKNRQITAVFTSLSEGGSAMEQSEVGISSLMDTWLLLRMVESANERNRIIYVLKSRGMAHSNQMREFLLTDQGIRLSDVYVGPGTVLTGSARLAQEAKDRQAELEKTQASALRHRELQQEREQLQAQFCAIQEKLRGLSEELSVVAGQETERLSAAKEERRQMVTARRAD